MATYVISDIHGQLDLFKDLLKRSNFKYDFTDELYILGDLADWGVHPIETMIYVMELCEKYSFIHCSLENHDAMLIDAVKRNLSTDDIYYDMWGSNDGVRTYEQYKLLDSNIQDKLIKFLTSLPLEFRDVHAGNRLYHLAHAAPSLPNDKNTGFDVLAREFWYRYDFTEYLENPISEQHMFICGHTMTKHFIGRMNNIPNQVLTDLRTMKMYIDCGGKAADSHEGYRLALVDLSNFKVMYSNEDGWKPMWMDDETRKEVYTRNFVYSILYQENNC